MKALLSSIRTMTVLALVGVEAIAQRAVPYGVVARCTDREWHFAYSPEVKEITATTLERFGGFSSCEFVKVAILPEAIFIRLHTPMDVDYSGTISLMRSHQDSPWGLVTSGRGMFGPPRLDASPSIDQFNSLISKVPMSLQKSSVRTLSDLYLFINDVPRSPFDYRASRELPRRLERISAKSNITMNQGGAMVLIKNQPWKLNFTFQGDAVQLSSAQKLNH